jgi:hypothetical protein
MGLNNQFVSQIFNLSCGYVQDQDDKGAKRRHVNISLEQAVILLEDAVLLVSTDEGLNWQEEKLRKRVAGLYFISGQFDKVMDF